MLFILGPRLICISQARFNSGWEGEKKQVTSRLAPGPGPLSCSVGLRMQALELPEALKCSRSNYRITLYELLNICVIYIYIYETKKKNPLQISPGLDVRDLLLLAAKTHLVLQNILKFVPVMLSISFLACVASGGKTTFRFRTKVLPETNMINGIIL